MFSSRYGMKTLSSRRLKPSNAIKKAFKKNSPKKRKSNTRRSRSPSPKRSPKMSVKSLEARLRRLEMSSFADREDSIEMMGSLPMIPSIRRDEKSIFAYDSSDASSLGSVRRSPRSARDSIELMGSLPMIPSIRRSIEEERKEERRMIPYASRRLSSQASRRDIEEDRHVIPYSPPSRKIVERKVSKGRKEVEGKRCIECDEPGTKIYCGRKCKLPDGYTRFGTPWECIQKGIYVGKMQR
jgi:hypothetical protein